MTLDDDDLVTLWREEFTAPRSGWDFGPLDGRLRESAPPWDFDAVCRRVLAGTASALDLGTGGGERLLTLLDVLPDHTLATEGWEPNVPVAAAALAPHGIDVVAYDADAEPRQSLPVPDARFDVVMSRHESYDTAEVARVLASGGVFVTQQVAGDDVLEIHDWFGAPLAYPDVRLDVFARRAQDAGLVVDEAAEWSGRIELDDVAALAWYLGMTPWDLPDDFTVDAHAETLLRLHRDGPARGEPIVITPRRFWLRAHRPA